MHFDFSNHPDFLVALTVVFAVSLVLSFGFLSAMLQRESVKRDLLDRGCEPLRIWWMPLSLRGTSKSRACFHVRYRDESGCMHKASCCVYVDLMDNPFFGDRRVRWYEDKMKGEP